MEAFQASATIASVAPTVAELFGTAAPGLASEPALPQVAAYRRQQLGSEAVQRCLIFCPDALGAHVWSRCPQHLPAISRAAPLRVALSSVVPPKTPVCFASMFTGGLPSEHGIRRYERPVLKCDTLFDSLIRAQRKIAIVAVQNSSVDLIFRERALEYHSEKYDPQVLESALQIIAADCHDLVVVYQQEYDDLLHKTEPYSNACLEAVPHHVESFAKLAEAAGRAWKGRNSALVFAPDHGAHVDSATGHGDHGEDIPEDMQLYHWYGIEAGQKKAMLSV